MHCDEPSCVDACPTHATYKAEDGVVMVDETRCIACGSCMRACPIRPATSTPRAASWTSAITARPLAPKGWNPPASAYAPPRRVFGDVDDPQSPVSKALGSHKVTFVEAEDAPTSRPSPI